MKLKKLKFTIFVVILAFFVSCTDELDTNSLENPKSRRTEIFNPLEGCWSLVNVSGGFAGTNTNFPKGWITWDFNTANQTITIVNNNLFEAPLYDGLESGTYNYNNTLTFTSCGNETTPINIINQFESCYAITNDTLTINNNQIADSFTLTLVRVNDNNCNYVVFGHYFGFCGGETCIEKFKLTSNKIYEDVNDVYPGVNSGTLPIYVQLPNNKFLAAQDLMTFFPNDLLTETNTTIGMPDASDGGGLYIKYHVNGVDKLWLIDQFKQNVPAQYHNFMDKVNEKIALMQ